MKADQKKYDFTYHTMALPYEENSPDAVLIENALHIVPDPEKVLSEIGRVPGRLSGRGESLYELVKRC